MTSKRANLCLSESRTPPNGDFFQQYKQVTYVKQMICLMSSLCREAFLQTEPFISLVQCAAGTRQKTSPTVQNSQPTRHLTRSGLSQVSSVLKTPTDRFGDQYKRQVDHERAGELRLSTLVAEAVISRSRWSSLIDQERLRANLLLLALEGVFSNIFVDKHNVLALRLEQPLERGPLVVPFLVQHLTVPRSVTR